MKSKPLNFIILFFLCSLCVLAQQPEYYANGQIKAEGKYKKNQKTGDWTYYYENGVVSVKESYHRKYPNIKMATYFHPNSKIKTSGELINDQKYGDWTWFRDDGTTEVFGNYTADRVNGALTYYNAKGIIEKKGGFRDKLKDGDWELYYFDGILMTKGAYKDGKEIGEWENYDRKGAYESTEIHPYEYDDIQFYDPMKDTRKYPESPTKKPFTLTYSNGKPEVEGFISDTYQHVGEWKWYYENGKLKEEGSFDDRSTRTGLWKTYYPTGVLRSEETYSGRNSTDYITYHTNGKIKFKKTDDGKYTTYFKTGEIYSVERRILGVSAGKEYFNKSGKLMDYDKLYGGSK